MDKIVVNIFIVLDNVDIIVVQLLNVFVVNSMPPHEIVFGGDGGGGLCLLFIFPV